MLAQCLVRRSLRAVLKCCSRLHVTPGRRDVLLPKGTCARKRRECATPALLSGVWIPASRTNSDRAIYGRHGSSDGGQSSSLANHRRRVAMDRMRNSGTSVVHWHSPTWLSEDSPDWCSLTAPEAAHNPPQVQESWWLGRRWPARERSTSVRGRSMLIGSGNSRLARHPNRWLGRPNKEQWRRRTST